MNIVEPDETDENEIDGDDVVKQPGHDQDQNPGDKRNERSDMSDGECHWDFLGGTSSLVPNNDDESSGFQGAAAGLVHKSGTKRTQGLAVLRIQCAKNRPPRAWRRGFG